MAPPRKEVTQADRDEIIRLAREGVGNVMIARKLDIHGHTVNGIIFNARKRGVLDPLPPNPDRKDKLDFPNAVMEMFRKQVEAAEIGARDAKIQVQALLGLITRLQLENDDLREKLSKRKRK